jgi:membrane associated rhomboid family serine protease
MSTDALFGGSPASTVLLATIVLGSLSALYRAPGLLERNLFRPYWFFRRKEYATLVTSAFLHADLAHLFFNGFTFWAFGFALERQIGTLKFVALYAAGLLAGGAGTYLKHRHQPGYRSLGASGAILAVLFAAIVYVPTASIYVLPIPIPIPAPVFALAYLAFTLYASRRAVGRVNHDAHLAGALAGIVFVALVDPSAVARALRHAFG